ncbi:P-loop containing nucleoside triphosphate hydrolase protein, partial [Mycena polygramma]
MPPQPSMTQIRLNNITKCLAATATSLEVLANSLKEPSLEEISNTTKSLLENLETVKQNKEECIQLLEQTHELLNAILVTYIKSETGADLPPSMSNHIGKFTETLHKINTFIEAQQKGSKIKRLFRQGELSTLLKNCKEGLQQGLESFQIDMSKIMKDMADIQKESEERHKEVLHLLETLSDVGSDEASTISRVFSGPHNSSTSISMLPSEPQIFHGRDSEVSDILQLFRQGAPKIAVLGAGGMGKTTVARAIVHHPEITARFDQHRYFVACDSATTKVQLAGLVGAHLGLKPGKDLTRAIVQHFSGGPPSLLILDNLETVWEPMESRHGVEEFLSLLTDVKHLALMITMRGAERPAKVAWTHPFLPPLRPLEGDAAHQTFIDIADDVHNPEEVEKLLALADNMPLAISLLAHLADSEGSSRVLSRWEDEKTSVVSDGHDKRSNLELSISLSLSSPRVTAFPCSLALLSLLSMLPNGLSDVELVQSKLPLDNILGCKATLIITSLAYSDSNRRVKVLVPIREYMMKVQPPEDNHIRALRKYFQQLLELMKEYHGTSTASSTVGRVSSNLANIQNVLKSGLQPDHPDLVDCIYCTCHLSQFSRLTAQGEINLMRQIPNIFPVPCDHRLEAYFATDLLESLWYLSFFGDLETVITQGLTHVEQCNDLDLKCKLQCIQVS